MFITPEVAYVCELLHKYDVLPLECDGHTMVVSCLLDRFCMNRHGFNRHLRVI